MAEISLPGPKIVIALLVSVNYIIKSYCTGFSEISCFASGKQITAIICRSRMLKPKQIIDLLSTDKTRLIFNNSFIIQQLIFFTINIFYKPPFSQKSDRMSRILFAGKHSWTTLRMSRPSFVGSYLQVTWWALGQ